MKKLQTLLAVLLSGCFVSSQTPEENVLEPLKHSLDTGVLKDTQSIEGDLLPADEGGNALEEATDLGTLTGTIDRTDFVGELDQIDYYRFELAEVSDLDVQVDGVIEGDLSVELVRSAISDQHSSQQTLSKVGPLLNEIPAEESIGNFVLSDVDGNDVDQVRHDWASVGRYFIKISRLSGNTKYHMQLSATKSRIPGDLAGEKIDAANDLGKLMQVTSVSDFVGDVDPVDLYRFSLSDVHGLTIRLESSPARAGFVGDADLLLTRDLDENGFFSESEHVAESQLSNGKSDLIDIEKLEPGDYFVQVNRYEGNARYSLVLIPTEVN